MIITPMLLSLIGRDDLPRQLVDKMTYASKLLGYEGGDLAENVFAGKLRLPEVILDSIMDDALEYLEAKVEAHPELSITELAGYLNLSIGYTLLLVKRAEC